MRLIFAGNDLICLARGWVGGIAINAAAYRSCIFAGSVFIAGLKTRYQGKLGTANCGTSLFNANIGWTVTPIGFCYILNIHAISTFGRQ